ncbi:MAG TPA: TolC family protein [Candidatus Obscuribacter sp.]|nr:TolC family protein [Candidatus Obscuribacter sp.]
MDRKRTAYLLTLIASVGVFQAPALAKRSWFHPVELQEKKPTFNVPTKYDTPPLVSPPSPDTPQSPDTQQAPDTPPLRGSIGVDSAASISWREFFADPNLVFLIETALANNQEFNIAIQDIQIAANEVKERQSEYLPKVGLGFGGSYIRPSENTPEGVLDTIVERDFYRYPDFNLNIGPSLSWEVDIWRRLRNAKDAARMRMVAQTEVRNFLISRLVTEIARTYYELMALDTSLKILDANISIQEAAFLKVQTLKRYAKANQLAVNRFEAQLNKTKSQRAATSQRVVEKENRLKFLVGRYDEAPIARNSDQFMTLPVNELQTGVPAQLLENRADIRQAAAAVKAAKLNLKSVKAQLYPNLTIRAGVGFSGFSPSLLFRAPQSLFYNAIGDFVLPLINRRAIIARIQTADANQTQAVLNYEQSLLRAYTDVLIQESNIRKMQQAFDTKKREVVLLEESIGTANMLFKYAKATYVEVLLTQEEKLNAERELVEVKLNLVGSRVELYRALGGGWR